MLLSGLTASAHEVLEGKERSGDAPGGRGDGRMSSGPTPCPEEVGTCSWPQPGL